ncbi:glycosyltransferase [Brevibacterium antiquum]|uniref:Glycosyl transferases group 1 n=2 Tax=Brevibacterium antiquum TaxID=234835 RepID=A0A2H1JQ66_9MICO|nr:glycosyltransferase [Brevibacterium antiquum]SMX89675.1 Glycosyl transferases group 1 [Brevibacterium antiquum CNRZ 918]SMX99545.1 Glycosyl transferases group 1 [Brevibacterium antiquum]
MNFTLIEPELGRISGGLRFNAELCAASGGRLERIVAPGAWPEPSDDDVCRLRQLVAECQSGSHGEPNAQSRPVLIDGLIGCSLSTSLPGPIVMLQHSLAQTPASEHREAQHLRAASAVVTPSAFAAAEVTRRYGITAEVAQPGTHRRPVTQPDPSPSPLPSQSAVGAAGSGDSCGQRAAHFICLGAMEDNKNQLFLSCVLQELRRRGVTGWRCTLAGPITDTAYAQDVDDALEGLASVERVGELDKDAVDDLYRHADLLLLPSKAESFGMVVREAAAAAIPSFVTAGTGAQEALGAGRGLALDVSTWADSLERWLGDEAHRAELAAKALAARESAMHEWAETARTVLAVLDSVEGVS